MSTWAKPGVKCVCVIGGVLHKGHPPKNGFPLEGRVYTIRELKFSPFHSNGLCAVLHELPNPWRGDPDYDAGWAVARFRPLVTRTQSEDVALFRKLLVPEGVDA